jgi:hypothetical protein
MAHSTLGPSGAKRWMNCPASIPLSAKLPPPPTSPAAAEGTVAHSLADSLMTGKLDSLGLMARIGETVMESGHEIEITEEMYDAVISYHDGIHRDIAAMEAFPRPAEVHHQTETKVHATSVDEAVWGTADTVVYRKGHKLIVRDFKYGKGVAVSPVENEQMALYAIGVMDTIKCWAFDEVELVIDQPRNGGESRWVTTVAWLKEFAQKAKAAAAETRAENPKMTAGTWCRWCPVQPVCPAMHKAAMASAAADFDRPPLARELSKMEARLPEVRLMSDEALINAFKWEETVNSFFEAVKEALRERLPPGIKLVEGRSVRKWTDESQVEAKFGPLLGERLFKREMLGPAGVEKLLGKKAGVDEMTFKPEGKKAIALDSDPRPAVKSSAVEDFSKAESLDEVLGLAPQAARAPIWP